jgi:hypothetical protein
MKVSAIDKAIEALEAKKDAYDKGIELAIQHLVEQRSQPKAPRAPRGTRKAKGKKEETL